MLASERLTEERTYNLLKGTSARGGLTCGLFRGTFLSGLAEREALLSERAAVSLRVGSLVFWRAHCDCSTEESESEVGSGDIFMPLRQGVSVILEYGGRNEEGR